jgi:hypothetical protein
VGKWWIPLPDKNPPYLLEEGRSSTLPRRVAVRAAFHSAKPREMMDRVIGSSPSSWGRIWHTLWQIVNVKRE